MDGLFHGKPYEQMDDLGGPTPIFGNPHVKVLHFFGFWMAACAVLARDSFFCRLALTDGHSIHLPVDIVVTW